MKTIAKKPLKKKQGSKPIQYRVIRNDSIAKISIPKNRKFTSLLDAFLSCKVIDRTRSSY
jgi:hypothetical protein